MRSNVSNISISGDESNLVSLKTSFELEEDHRGVEESTSNDFIRTKKIITVDFCWSKERTKTFSLPFITFGENNIFDLYGGARRTRKLAIVVYYSRAKSQVSANIKKYSREYHCSLCSCAITRHCLYLRIQ